MHSYSEYIIAVFHKKTNPFSDYGSLEQYRRSFCVKATVIDCKKADWYNTYEKDIVIQQVFVIVLKKWLHMYK